MFRNNRFGGVCGRRRHSYEARRQTEADHPFRPLVSG